ncbi:PD-(D/E)XK nuclease family protein [Selenomonas dianae]|uniref:Helicase-exonuclease AddAB subunit AddB n=1 Tax=Selenomonas dianae TaxID=135079 RepID=A0ABN0SYA0_9FIRM|nr:PD-(D/E)XK nuclease family protein [Selenomonas dianae]WLD81385.1 PD-(D/E)XK nuclease family protein [Selenomonas dianae]
MTAKLEFIIGRAGTGKTHTCLASMTKALEHEPLGRQRILLVPEHMTYAAERMLAESLTHSAGFLQAYVFGFRRLARQVLIETGGAHLPRISDIGRRILLKDILLKHEKELSVFVRSIGKHGFTETLGRTIAELKRYRLTTDVLRAAADDTHTQGRLSQKLKELALIMDDLSARMEGRLTDQTDRMERLAAQLKEAPFLRGAEIWVDGFDFFNPQEMAVFHELFRTADTVHISLTMDGRRSGNRVQVNLPENIRDTGLFARSYQTMQALTQLLAEIDPTAAPEIRLMEEQQRAQKPSLAAMERHLFGHERLVPITDHALKLVEAANPRLEAEAVASDVLRLARDEGYRYREIAVLVRDMDTYADLLLPAFSDCGIPCHLDAKRPSTHHPLAELLRAAAQTAWRGWGYDTVFRALRTGFFPVVTKGAEQDGFSCGDWEEAVDRLENYCLAFGIRSENQWTATEDWDFVRRTIPEDARATEQNAARIAEETTLDAIRRRIATPLSLLTQHLRREESTAQERTLALYKFLTKLDVPQTLEVWRAAADAEGRLADAAAHRQIWASCMTLLEQLVEVSGDEDLSARDFEELLEDGLDALEIALIPPGLDHVTIASFDQNSLAGIRAAYIVGANAGMMPRAGTSQGVLSDADRLSIRESLEHTKHTISGGSHEQSFLERYQLYRGFTEAREYLWISYALSSADGAALAPSPLIARLRTICPTVLSIPLAMVEREDDLVLSAPHPVLSSLAGALLARKERGRMRPIWGDVYNWMRSSAVMEPLLRLMVRGLVSSPREEDQISSTTAKHLFARDGRISGSTTRLETFCQCPFRHFAMYGLGLRERDVYEFQSNDFGTLLHEILHGYGEWVRTQHANDWCAAEPDSAAKIDELMHEAIPRIRSSVLMSRASYRHRIERIRCTAQQVIRHLTSWAKASSFHPLGFEVSFGRRTDDVKLQEFQLAGGATLSLRGQIDRFDVTKARDYYLVLDYKTGGTSLLLPEIRHGLKMQLLLYLFVVRSLLHDTDSFPAGMLYAPVVNPIIKSDVRLGDRDLQRLVAKDMVLTGMLIDDPEITQSIDAMGEHLCITFNKDKSISKASARHIRSREEFEQLLAYLPQLIRTTAEEILRGNIQAAPYRFRDRNACTFCTYRSICSFDPELGQGDRYREIADNAQAAMEEIAQMVCGEVTSDG